MIEHSLFHNVADPKEQGTAFDPTAFYSCTIDPATALPEVLAAFSGPQDSIGR
ncbi:hypothetical protein [Nonomuraea jabiensis]|uniref:hypothetical protein n=1 Tax=Nonomuraea jabiensis TaxID=882448 RepID=UPI003D761022